MRLAVRTHRSRVAFLALAAATVAGVWTFVAEPVQIPSSSMAPTLRPGDHVLVDKFAYRTGRPGRGELALLHEPGTGELVLKRIVAVGGDTVAIEDGVLVVNGRRPVEPYADPESIDSQYFGPVRVRRGTVFVLGDNRGDSIDSREFGVVPTNELVGRAATRIWPASRWGGLS